MNYIWITRWKDFQHYPPRRDRGPAWIKDYTAQLDDARYLTLTDRQRALLRDLRDIFATFRGRLPDDVAMIARKRNLSTRRVDLEELNHAGFVEFCSRETLEARLEELYASRAPAGSQDREAETETPLLSTPTAEANGAAPEPVKVLNNLGAESLPHALRLISNLREGPGHRDEGTARVIQTFAHKLPPAAFEDVRERLAENRSTIKSDGKWVVSELKRKVDEKRKTPAATHDQEQE